MCDTIQNKLQKKCQNPHPIFLPFRRVRAHSFACSSELAIRVPTIKYISWFYRMVLAMKVAYISDNHSISCSMYRSGWWRVCVSLMFAARASEQIVAALRLKWRQKQISNLLPFMIMIHASISIENGWPSNWMRLIHIVIHIQRMELVFAMFPLFLSVCSFHRKILVFDFWQVLTMIHHIMYKKFFVWANFIAFSSSSRL